MSSSSSCCIQYLVFLDVRCSVTFVPSIVIIILLSANDDCHHQHSAHSMINSANLNDHLIPGIPPIPEMDISFVISATSIDANTNFKTMKDIVKVAADQYGTDRLRYNVIVFGNTPNVQLQFTSKFPTDEDFKVFVANIPRASSGRALDKSLVKAQMVLEKDGRSNAKKVDF